jgi:hypothetical protein
MIVFNFFGFALHFILKRIDAKGQGDFTEIKIDSASPNLEQKNAGAHGKHGLSRK